MLSANTLMDTGKILLGMIVGVIAIIFNQNEKIEMKNTGKSLGLRTTVYAVSDVKAAKEWYSMAFETEPYFDEDFYVGFSINGYELGLLPGKDEEKNKCENVLTYWGVNDIEKTYKYLLENGASKGGAPTDVGEGLMVAHVFDPWNNALGIIYNPFFKIQTSDDAESVVEWAPFELKDGVNENELRSISDQLQKEFLAIQKGFVKRELLKKGERQWVDLVYWETSEDADNAMSHSQQSTVCASYFELMEMSDSVDASQNVIHLNPHYS